MLIIGEILNRICCIYLITNLKTKKFYLGSTLDFQKRKSSHLNKLSKNKHHSKYLQNSYNKYGKELFTIDIYQFSTEEERLELEDYYLKCYKPKYNVSKNAFAPMTGRKHDKATKLKMKSWIRKKGKENHNYGKKLSEEHKQKLQLLKIGSKRSEKTKRKMSLTAKRINSISRVDRTKTYKKIKDDLGIVFNTLTEASKYYKVSIQAICDNLKGRSICLKNGRQFKYLNDDSSFIDNPILIRLLGYNNLSVEQLKQLKIDINILPRKELYKKYNFDRTKLHKFKNSETYKYV